MRETSEVIAGFLRVEEADMLAELLGSAGIEARIEGAITGGLGALLPGAAGGARLRVRFADAVRARELVARSGVFAHGPAAEGDEIPEAEWAAPVRPETRAGEAAPASAQRAWGFLVPLALMLAEGLILLGVLPHVT